MQLLKHVIPLFFMGLILLTATISHEVTSANPTSGSISAFSEVNVEWANAYSHSGAYAIRDCLRPSHIDCFSVQQNFWISDASGDLVFWARNSVELANLGGIYFGTYLFQLYSHDNRNQPLLCEPESNSSSTCRSPFYEDNSPFPQSLKFYSHISNTPQNNTLQMTNNFGAATLAIPLTVTCPCFIETVPRLTQPWGSSPFELVAVGIDDTATATFRNGTRGIIGPTLIQSSDQTWHGTTLSTIGCPQIGDCLSALSTQENSMSLLWDTQKGEFYWSNEAIDQGVYITHVMQGNASPPVLPIPKSEDYLYVRFYSALAYLSIYDGLQRLAGIDPQTGRAIATLPNSSVVFSSYVPVKDSPVTAPEEELLILDPQGTYRVVVTAGGNTAYNLFLSRATNTNKVLATNSIVGSLIIGDSKGFEVKTENLNVSPETTLFPGLPSMFGIIAILVGLVLVLLALLAFRRRRIKRLSKRDLDEF